MADVMPHFCTGQGCEALHGGGAQSDEVRIARINADRDIRVAELSRSEMRELAEAGIEETAIIAGAQTEQAEVMAEAAVEESVVEAEVLGDIVNPDPEPVVVEIADGGDETGGDIAPAPPETAPQPEEKKSEGWWGGYR